MLSNPHITPEMPVRPGAVYVAILGGTALWCGLIVLAPLLEAAGEQWSGPAGALYTFFHRICHQLEGRSLHLAGQPLAVCARCSAIYFAFFAGTLLYPLLYPLRTTGQPPRAVLVLAGLPMLLDVLAGLTGFHEATIATRVATGSVAGLILPFFLLPAAIGAVGQIITQRHQSTIPSTSERTR